jgi:hypothetical protein
VYRITTDDRSQPQIDALSADALPSWAEARVVLEVSPWSGQSLNAANPQAGVRTLTFGPNGEGLITYLILEDQRWVDILDVLWIG